MAKFLWWSFRIGEGKYLKFVQNGAKSHVLSKYALVFEKECEFSILSKMRFWKCEFCEKWDFEIVNFWMKYVFCPCVSQIIAITKRMFQFTDGFSRVSYRKATSIVTGKWKWKWFFTLVHFFRVESFQSFVGVYFSNASLRTELLRMNKCQSLASRIRIVHGTWPEKRIIYL